MNAIISITGISTSCSCNERRSGKLRDSRMVLLSKNGLSFIKFPPEILYFELMESIKDGFC